LISSSLSMYDALVCVPKWEICQWKINISIHV
jgi:hypothetical protein